MPDPPHIALIHGGCWRQRYDRSLMQPLADDLAAAGFHVHNLEYRRLGLLRSGGWPGTFDDITAAIEAIGRPLVTVGHSAGGQLAAWAASLPSVVATVSQAGILDLREAARLGVCGGQARRLVAGDERLYPLASPIERLPLRRPSLLVHGLDDRVVPPSQSRRYHRAASAAGDRCRLVELEQVGHYEHLDPRSGAWRIVREWLEALQIS